MSPEVKSQHMFQLPIHTDVSPLGQFMAWLAENSCSLSITWNHKYISTFYV